MSQTITLPQGATLTFPFPIPGFPPSTTTGPSSAQPDISAILAALMPILEPLLKSVGGAANPLLGLAISAIFAIGKAIHDQKQNQPAGSNPSLDALEKDFWSHVTAFFPHPQSVPQQPLAG